MKQFVIIIHPNIAILYIVVYAFNYCLIREILC